MKSFRTKDHNDLQLAQFSRQVSILKYSPRIAIIYNVDQTFYNESIHSFFSLIVHDCVRPTLDKKKIFIQNITSNFRNELGILTSRPGICSL